MLLANNTGHICIQVENSRKCSRWSEEPVQTWIWTMGVYERLTLCFNFNNYPVYFHHAEYKKDKSALELMFAYVLQQLRMIAGENGGGGVLLLINNHISPLHMYSRWTQYNQQLKCCHSELLFCSSMLCHTLFRLDKHATYQRRFSRKPNLL